MSLVQRRKFPHPQYDARDIAALAQVRRQNLQHGRLAHPLLTPEKGRRLVRDVEFQIGQDRIPPEQVLSFPDRVDSVWRPAKQRVPVRLRPLLLEHQGLLETHAPPVHRLAPHGRRQLKTLLGGRTAKPEANQPLITRCQVERRGRLRRRQLDPVGAFALSDPYPVRRPVALVHHARREDHVVRCAGEVELEYVAGYPDRRHHHLLARPRAFFDEVRHVVRYRLEHEVLESVSQTVVQGIYCPLHLRPQVPRPHRNLLPFVLLAALAELAEQRAQKHLYVAENPLLARERVVAVRMCPLDHVDRWQPRGNDRGLTESFHRVHQHQLPLVRPGDRFAHGRLGFGLGRKPMLRPERRGNPERQVASPGRGPQARAL